MTLRNPWGLILHRIGMEVDEDTVPQIVFRALRASSLVMCSYYSLPRKRVTRGNFSVLLFFPRTCMMAGISLVSQIPQLSLPLFFCFVFIRHYIFIVINLNTQRTWVFSLPKIPNTPYWHTQPI